MTKRRKSKNMQNLTEKITVAKTFKKQLEKEGGRGNIQYQYCVAFGKK